ncbi:MAG: class I SAM-dependent methyltransferase [Candidatus Sumerlaea chitinivorans]|nr:class I SAM-dependent methyltransferase [Candidatus Sumerlaea chitinivorans]
MRRDDVPDQRHYWDANLDPQNVGASRRAELVAEIRREREYFFTPERRALLSALGPLEGKIILEIGAGLSYQVLYFAEGGARVIACDLSRERLAALRSAARALLTPEAAARILYVQGAAEALPLRTASCDAVCTKSVLIHTNLPKSVSEAARVLRPGGSSAFTEPMRKHPLVNLYRRTLAPREWRAITNYFGDEEIDCVCRAFPDAHLRYDYLASFLAFIWQFGVRCPALFWVTLPPLNALDRLLFRWFPNLQRYAWFVTILGRRPV